MNSKSRASGWRPGQSGNPKGRPPGTGDVAKLRASIAAHVPQIIESLVDRAVSGDIGAARLLLERVVAPLRAVDLPQQIDIACADKLGDQGREVLSSVVAGDMAVGQGAALISALGSLARVVEVDELTRRIEALEDRHAKS